MTERMILLVKEGCSGCNEVVPLARRKGVEVVDVDSDIDSFALSVFCGADTFPHLTALDAEYRILGSIPSDEVKEFLENLEVGDDEKPNWS
ncbi:MAG TPA: hypothetical protein VM238_18495 [Phycisphaerae bacterium]|nr:hypothetical protein [Phycisphaerae bacterium]